MGDPERDPVGIGPCHPVTECCRQVVGGFYLEWSLRQRFLVLVRGRLPGILHNIDLPVGRFFVGLRGVEADLVSVRVRETGQNPPERGDLDASMGVPNCVSRAESWSIAALVGTPMEK